MYIAPLGGGKRVCDGKLRVCQYFGFEGPPPLCLSCRKPGKGKVKQKTNVTRATLVLPYVNLVIVMRLYSLVRYIHMKKTNKVVMTLIK